MKSKIINLLPTILIILFNFQVQAQNKERKYEPFEFEGYKPVWQHAVIDTSIIGLFNEIDSWTGDSVFYDGFSNFYPNIRSKLFPVYIKNKVIITEHKNGSACEGAFIQCIDIKTGNVGWEIHYDLRTDSRKEWPVWTYINENGQFVLLGHRQNISLFNPIPKPFWFNSLLTIRKYNSETGYLEERITIPENDPFAKRLAVPEGIFGDGAYGTYIFPDIDNVQFITTTNKVIKSYTLNNESHVTDSVYYDFGYDSLLILNYLYLTDQNNIINLRFSSKSMFDQANIDSFKISYTVHDRDLNILYYKTFQENIKPADRINFLNVSDTCFIVLGTEYRQIKDKTISVFTLSHFDAQANLKETVTLNEVQADSVLFNYDNVCAVKLKNDKGILMAADYKGQDGFDYLNFFKTDGYGNFEKIKKLKIHYSNHSILPLDLVTTPEGDILLKALDFNKNLVNDLYRGYATVYILFSAEDLGLKTSATSIAKARELMIYPNPANDYIILSRENTEAGYIEIIDQLGRIVSQENTLECEEKSIDISGLNPGLYFMRLINNSGREVGSGKFVKGK
jgi:hypothetical protein